MWKEKSDPIAENNYKQTAKKKRMFTLENFRLENYFYFIFYERIRILKVKFNI